MRLGLITSSYPQGPGDVAGGFVRAHVGWLQAQGHVVDVIALPRASGAMGIPDAFEAIAAMPAAARIAAQTRHLAGLSRAAASLTRQAWRAAPAWDAVCAHWLVPAATAGLVATWRAGGGHRVPYLAIAHGGDVHVLERAGLLQVALARLVASEARIAWVSAALRDHALLACGAPLRAQVKARSLVCAMGVDDDRFAALAARRGAIAGVAARAPALNRPVRLLVVARLVTIKGIDLLLATLRHVASPCDLTIVGDGPLRAALQQQAQALHATSPQHRVVFRGALVGAALDDAYAEAEAVVLPSRVARPGARGEGMPVVALEAMAAGIPLIHSGSGGLADLADLTHLTGLDSLASFSADRATASPRWQLDFNDPVKCAQSIENIINILMIWRDFHAEASTQGATGSTSDALTETGSDERVQASTPGNPLGWNTVGPRLWSHWHG